MTLDGADAYHGTSITSMAELAPAIRFLFLKASEGATFTDPTFTSRSKAAGAQGLPWAPYHLVHAKASASSQLATLKAAIGSGGWGFGPMVDVESAGLDSSQAAMVAVLGELLPALEAEAGRPPLIYTSAGEWAACTGGSRAFGSWPLFVASTLTPPTLPAGWKAAVFQQHGQGHLPGTTGLVDLDWWLGSEAGFEAYIGGAMAGEADEVWASALNLGADGGNTSGAVNVLEGVRCNYRNLASAGTFTREAKPNRPNPVAAELEDYQAGWDFAADLQTIAAWVRAGGTAAHEHELPSGTSGPAIPPPPPPPGP